MSCWRSCYRCSKWATIVIDGGNSYYRDDIRRAADLLQNGMHYVDVGGGVAGLERGYCLMIGGEKAIVRHLAPIFATLAPGVGAAARPRSTQGHSQENRQLAHAEFQPQPEGNRGHRQPSENFEMISANE